MSNFPKFTIQDMLEAGVHFGHKQMLWNPKMQPFIYSSRNGVHIIDLQKTAALLDKALKVVSNTSKRRNPKILFVGTKRQASDIIKSSAIKCGQFYVNHRWLGGMLTNWPTVSKSIKTLEELEIILKNAQSGQEEKYNKKELLDFDRKRQKLESSLGGIRNMKGKPDLIFIIDTNKEEIAIKEAKLLNIPIIAVVDTNSEIDLVDYVIPGNDDAGKAIQFYCRLMSDAVLYGVEEFLSESGVEIDKNNEDIVTQDAKEEISAEEEKNDIALVSNEQEKKLNTEQPAGEIKTKPEAKKSKASSDPEPVNTKVKKKSPNITNKNRKSN